MPFPEGGLISIVREQLADVCTSHLTTLFTPVFLLEQLTVTCQTMTVPGPSNTTRGQDLAAQVWYLPHIRQSVFEELARDPSLNESPYTFLRRHLTLDKATFLDIAPMLYNSTSLDRFPLDCPDEVRNYCKP